MSSKSQIVLALCPVNTELKFSSDIRTRIAVDLGAPYHCFCRIHRWSPMGALRMAATTDIRALLLRSWRDHSSEHGKCWQSSRRLRYRCSPPKHQYNRQSIFTLLPVFIIPTKGTSYIVIKDSWHHAKTNNAISVPLILKQRQYMERLWERFKTRLGRYSPQLACSDAFFASWGYL